MNQHLTKFWTLESLTEIIKFNQAETVFTWSRNNHSIIDKDFLDGRVLKLLAEQCKERAIPVHSIEIIGKQ